MTEPIAINTVTPTLALRIAEGRIPVADALRYAMILAEALRELHDESHVHGAIAPCNIRTTPTGVELMEPRETPTTPFYAAPEVLEGLPADIRSDVFSFGTVLFEMLTGRAPFQGKRRGAPASTNNPAVDRLLAACLARDPADRPRMQKIILELKLLSVSAARGNAAASAQSTAVADTLRSEIAQAEARLVLRMEAQERRSAELLKAVSEAMIRRPEESEDLHRALLQTETRVSSRMQTVEGSIAELQIVVEALNRSPLDQLDEMEARVAARLAANETAMAEVQRAAGEAVTTLRGQLNTVEAELAAVQERAARAEHSIEASGDRVVALVQQSIDAMTARIARVEQRLAGLEQRDSGPEPERLVAVEKGLEEMRTKGAELHDLVAEDMLNFENSLKAQASALESTRTAMAHTDDLVERVVEALETLQNAVLDPAQDQPVAVK